VSLSPTRTAAELGFGGPILKELSYEALWGYSSWCVVQVKGFGHILCCAWRGDNAGPHSPDEVHSAEGSRTFSTSGSKQDGQLHASGRLLLDACHASA
jgi:hypothetical protein